MAHNNRSASTNWRRNVAAAVAAAQEDEINEEQPELQQQNMQPVYNQQDLIEAPRELASENENEEDFRHEGQDLPMNPELPVYNGEMNVAALREDAHMFEAETGINDSLNERILKITKCNF